MVKHHKLSLIAAVLININIMFGTGVFINTVNLAKLAGALGFLAYGIVALLLLPLIKTIAALIKRYPNGNFYIYAAHDIAPVAGFISSWAYFTGKLASVALLVHVFTSLMQAIVPDLQVIPPLLLDSIILVFFGWLNTLNMKTGSQLMYVFVVLKFTPILFAILTGLYLWQVWTIPSYTFLWSGLPASLPLVLYAFTGFEASCALSKSIENAEKNGPRAVFISYTVVVLVTIVYQLVFFAAAGPLLMGQKDFTGAFPSLLSLLRGHKPELVKHVVAILHAALASSALGSSYGILFSNHWNLYALAQHNHVFGARWLTRLNAHHIPIIAVVAEVLLCLSYLFITRGSQIPLQQISVLGCTIAYTLSVLSVLNALRSGVPIYTSKFIVWSALGSCLLLISACVRNFMINGTGAFIAFIGILSIGLLMFFATVNKTDKKGMS